MDLISEVEKASQLSREEQAKRKERLSAGSSTRLRAMVSFCHETPPDHSTSVADVFNALQGNLTPPDLLPTRLPPLPSTSQSTGQNSSALQQQPGVDHQENTSSIGTLPSQQVGPIAAAAPARSVLHRTQKKSVKKASVDSQRLEAFSRFNNAMDKIAAAADRLGKE